MIRTVKRKLAGNFIFIGLAQALNQFTPIAILPYLSRTVGMEAVGAIVFSQVLMNYLGTVVDYGFSISATRRVALHRGNAEELSNLFSSVLWVKGSIALAVLLLLAIASPLIPWPVLIVLLSFPLVAGKVLMPQWLFWGLEKNSTFVAASLLAKLFFIVFLFGFVKTADDAPWVNFALGSSDVLVGLLLTVHWIPKHLNVKIRIIEKRSLVQFTREGWTVFVSNVAASLYLNAGVLLLGQYVSGLNFGKYAVAERITTTPRLVSGLLLQAVYPHASRLAIESGKIAGEFISWFRKLIILLYMLCAGALFLLADFLTFLFTGVNDVLVSSYIQIFCILPLVVATGIPSYLELLIKGKNKNCMYVFLFGALLNISLNWLLLPLFHEKAAIAVAYLTEVIVAGGFVVMARRLNNHAMIPIYS